MAFDKNIFDINGKDILSMATFADEDVIAFDNIRDICLNEKVKIENFIIALCNKGRGALTINGVDYNVGVGDFVMPSKPHHREHDGKHGLRVFLLVRFHGVYAQCDAHGKQLGF